MGGPDPPLPPQAKHHTGFLRWGCVCSFAPLQRHPACTPLPCTTVLFAEVVHHYFPKMVELHNYSSASSVRQKLYNWSTLNGAPPRQPAHWPGPATTPPPPHLPAKVFKRLKFSITKEEMEDTVNCVPGVVEMLLMRLQSKMAAYRQRKAAGSSAAASGGGMSARSGMSTGDSMAAPSEGALYIDGARGSGGGVAPSTLQVARHAELVTAVADKDTSIQELSETIEVRRCIHTRRQAGLTCTPPHPPLHSFSS